MKNHPTILALLFVGAVALAGIFLPILPAEELGTGLTPINATDTIKATRTLLNDNFDYLDDVKIDVATATIESLTSAPNLATIGTITSGIWQGTVVTDTYGGTGSSTPFGILCFEGGNVLGVATGTAGQLLTFVGDDSCPEYTTTTVDQAADYEWSGVHNFSSTAMFQTLRASSTIEIAGVSYTFPTDGASSTVLATDASGGLSFVKQDWFLLTSTSTEESLTTATTSSFTAHDQLYVVIYVADRSGNINLDMTFNTDKGNNYAWGATTMGSTFTDSSDTGSDDFIRLTGGGGAMSSSSPLHFALDIRNVASARKSVLWTGSSVPESLNVPGTIHGSAVWNDTTNAITQIVIQSSDLAQTFGANTEIYVYGLKKLTD